MINRVRGRVYPIKVRLPAEPDGWYQPTRVVMRWGYQVLYKGRVIHSDNGSTYEQAMDDCRRSVAAFSFVLFTGHRLKDKTWDDVVDRFARKEH